MKSESGTHRGLVSRGTSFKAPGTTEVEYVYILDILGSDTTALRKHIAKHLLKIKENVKGPTQLMIFFQEYFGYNEIMSTFTVCGIEDTFLAEGCRKEPYALHIYERWKSLS